MVLVAGVVVMQAYVLPFKWWWATGYSVVFILIPLLILLRKLVKAITPADFHTISTLLKLIMLSGILSMLFFKLYT
jgi:4-hydroxybenzoate polyprenyltransferase